MDSLAYCVSYKYQGDWGNIYQKEIYYVCYESALEVYNILVKCMDIISIDIIDPFTGEVLTDKIEH